MPMQSQSSIRMKFFTKVPFLGVFFEKRKDFQIFEKKWGTRLLLYEFSRGNQVDGSPRVAVIEVMMFCSMTFGNRHRFRCDTYYEDSYEAN